jgi:transcription initiation factor TFIIB
VTNGATRQRLNRETNRSEAKETARSGTEETAETVDLDNVDHSDVVRTAEGELIHEPTGLILEDDQIDRGPEWRAFNQSERQNRSRVGSPTTQTMHDKGLTTQIDWKSEDAYGRSLSMKKRNQMRRLRKWQERIRTKDAGERNLQLALSEIDRMSSALGIPRSVREVASVMYRRALSEDLIRGRSIEGISTAVLYAACRQEGIPRSLNEVTEVSRVENKEIARTYRYIAQELELEMQPVDPKKYLPRFCSQLGVSEKAQSKAEEIIDASAEQGLLSGKSPTGFAAAAIYSSTLFYGEKKTQKEVADVAQVTEVTIRNRYQEQIEIMISDESHDCVDFDR